MHALPVFDLAGRHIKPYHITREPDGVLAPEIVDAAYAIAADLATPWATSRVRSSTALRSAELGSSPRSAQTVAVHWSMVLMKTSLRLCA